MDFRFLNHRPQRLSRRRLLREYQPDCRCCRRPDLRVRGPEQGKVARLRGSGGQMRDEEQGGKGHAQDPAALRTRPSE